MTDKNDLDKLLADLLDNWEQLSDRQQDAVTLSLGEAGPAALEPILEALEKTDAESQRHALLDAASSLGVHDKRLRAHLVELLDPHPFLAAMLLLDYDDPNTLPDLLRTRDRLEADSNDDAHDTIRELERAIEAIETTEDLAEYRTGATAEELRSELEELQRENAQLRQEIAQRGEPYRKGAGDNLGRNDPCWCGSGRKYKRCHLTDDNR